MVKCRDCGHSISPSARTCPQCGAHTEAAIRADERADEDSLTDFLRSFGIILIICLVVAVIIKISYGVWPIR